MKKLLGIIVLGLLCCSNVSFSADFEASWKYDSSWDKITISAYNGNPSMSLTVTKMKIWFSSCSYNDGEPDRIFNVNKLVRPYSSREITFYAELPNSKKCATIAHKMYTPTVYKAPKIKECRYTDYEEPCTCDKEPNAIKKTYCELRVKNANKSTRSEAAAYCAGRADDYSKEVGAEYYKDCMKDEGF